jgi:hypothetical protein
VADADLRAGHDMLVAQYLGRTKFIETLEQLADRTPSWRSAFVSTSWRSSS